MRCFVAVELPETIRESLAELSRRVRQSRVRASWVSPENLHITLRFLGEISEKDAVNLVGLLELLCGEFPCFRLSARGVGAFPNMRAPSVLWAGVQPSDGDIARLQEKTEEAAQRLGCKKEKNRFHPHVTFARIKDPRGAAGITHFLEDERNWCAGEFNVCGITLFRSELTPRGPLYTKLHTVSLRPDSISTVDKGVLGVNC